MSDLIEFSWSYANEQNKKQQTKQQKALQAFLSESHELTDGRDLWYWMNATGKDLNFLVSNASGIAENIKQAVNFGCSIDDIVNLEPQHLEVDDTETPDDTFEDIHIFYLKTNNFLFNNTKPEYQIIVSDTEQELNFFYPDDDTIYHSLEECRSQNKADLKAFFDAREAEAMKLI